jgi:hypothetical protein
MASTILYKFRSGTTFEALPLPGSAARLFDVKKAIVKAKKLDSGTMEFDLAVRNADTNEEYVNEGMLLPRGTRLIVQRLPAARGNGFLARMARNEHAGGAAQPGAPQQQSGAPPSGFYTIDSRTRDDDDEFVQSGTGADEDEEKELAALQAVTSLRPSDGPAMTGGYSGGGGGGGGGGRGGHPQGGGGRGGGRGGFTPSFRPNADPELRDQERKLMPKKRATGIPRTFLNLSAPPQTDGLNEGGENEPSVPLLQPNTIGFEELVNRGGGKSENASGTRRDLDYALKVTATTIPDYLQCGICNSVVKNAMLLPWDPEGRTACESCIRDALTQNGFRCPLTGIDGVSPDDLHPNVGLRKAAALFIKGVMEKIDEIEKMQVDEAEDTVGGNHASNGVNILEGDGTDKGIILSKRTALSSRKKSDDDDPFGGGDDDFGGDVFAVEAEKPEEEEDLKDAAKEVETKEPEKAADEQPEKAEPKETQDSNQDKDGANEESKNKSIQSVSRNDKDLPVSNDARHSENGVSENPTSDKNQDIPNNQRDRRENRRRGPPVGYAMGPAGGAVSGPHGRNGRDQGGRGGGGRGRDNNSPADGGRGGGGFQGYQDRAPFQGRGRSRGRGRFGGRHDMDGGSGRGFQHHEGSEERGSPHQSVSLELYRTFVFASVFCFLFLAIALIHVSIDLVAQRGRSTKWKHRQSKLGIKYHLGIVNKTSFVTLYANLVIAFSYY